MVTLGTLVVALAPALLTWGWIFVTWLVLWLAWEGYLLQKRNDYFDGMQWAYLQVQIPELTELTPKSMDNIIAVMSGMHKNPDLAEKYFEGYLEDWYSLEMQCLKGRVRYIVVVPQARRQFMEGVIYGQYPTAQITEVEDYTKEFHVDGIRTEFDLYGTDIWLSQPDCYPIRTYQMYTDKLAPKDKFVDPHKALVEAYTNLHPGEQIWLQVLVRPVGGRLIDEWSKKAEAEIARIRGVAGKIQGGIFKRAARGTARFLGNILRQLGGLTPEASSSEDEEVRFFDPVETAKMEGILQKTVREPFQTVIRIVYVAPLGQLHSPSLGRIMGALQQFNTLHLNSFQRDASTNSRKPDYFFKEHRRAFRERMQYYYYRIRWLGGVTRGMMMTAEEIATVYHFPAKWVRTPGLERPKSGVHAAPKGVPFV